MPTVPGKVLLYSLLSRLSWIVFQLFAATAIAGILLWLSVFLYGAFYYAYMPAVVHERPVHFKFRANCESEDKHCSFPSANLSLLKNGREILAGSQAYVVKLELDMPESIANQQIGMFMARIEFYTHSGEVTHSAEQSAIIRYKSFLFRTLETFVYFWPSLFISTPSESQTITVQLCDNFLVDPYRPAVGVTIELQSRKVEIYSAVLKIHARFTGLRYLLYHWPLLAAFCGITSNFCFFSVAAFFFWCTFIARSTFNEQCSKPVASTATELPDQPPLPVSDVLIEQIGESKSSATGASQCETGMGDPLADESMATSPVVRRRMANKDSN